MFKVKKIKKGLLSMIGISVLMVSPLYATEPVTMTEQSTASIRFVGGTGPTAPVDPEEPGEPMEPPGVAVDGELVIVYVSDFDFGEGQVSVQTKKYDIQTVQPNVQIVDLRGAMTGWYLDAAVSSFQDSDNVASLNGANLYILDGNLNSLTPMSYAPTVKQNVTLTTDGEPARILEAGNGKGSGLWVNRFYPSTSGVYVQLEVLGGTAVKGAHSATITWTLSDTP